MNDDRGVGQLTRMAIGISAWSSRQRLCKPDHARRTATARYAVAGPSNWRTAALFILRRVAVASRIASCRLSVARRKQRKRTLNVLLPTGSCSDIYGLFGRAFLT